MDAFRNNTARRVELNGYHLDGVDLSGLDLRLGNFRGTSFVNANLAGAQLGDSRAFLANKRICEKPT